MLRSLLVGWCFVYLALQSAALHAQYATIPISLAWVSLYPQEPNPHSDLKLRIDTSAASCTVVSPNRVVIDPRRREFHVSLSVGAFDFGPCVIRSSAMPPYDINLGNPRESGTYSVYVYDEHLFDESAPFKPENLAGTFTFEIDYQIIGQPDDSNIVYPETPAEGSEQSGVGLVRGWACDAWRVEIQFDDGPRREVAYGTDRSDTREICGDDDNGYGLILAWGLLGHGGHTMRTYVNNELVDTVNFRVDGLDDPFLKGVSAEYTLEDFPAPGERVIVRWSEADQNFIIFDVQ